MRVRKDGSRFLASIVFTALHDPAGNLRGFSGICRDLSESKESGAKYRGLLEAAPDAMVVVNQGGEIVLLNLQAEKEFGYRRDELVGQKVTNIIPEGFAERLVADDLRSAEDALAQEIGSGIELTGRRKDGSEFPIEIMLSPLESAEGILVTAAIRDISVRKAAEKHLAQMEGRYRGLLEAAPDAMVVVNQDGEIVLLNLQAEKQFGYRRDELLGQKVTNIIPEGFAERLVADDLRSAEDALAQQIGTGIELTGRRKDGSEFPIEIMLSPLESAEGILVTAAIRDISVRKAAEKHLAQMEGRYRGLLEAAPDAMVVVNQDGEIVLLNVQAEKQFGYRRDELLGQKVTNIIPEGFAERLVADDLRSAEDALAQQIGTGIELTGRRKDGSEFPIEIMLSPLESAEGILVTAAIRDISVRKAAEKHLAQMEGRYRGLLEAAPDAMVVVNQGGEIVLLNVQAEKQFGYRRDELLGQKVTNIIPEGFAERLIADGSAIRGRRAGAADRHRDRAHRAAQGRQRVSDRDHAEPAGERRGHPGDGGDPRHQRAQGRGKASGADGGPVSRAAGGGARRDGGGEPGRRDRPAERAGRKAVRLPPRRAARPEGHEHHSGGLCGAADRGRSALRGRRAGAADRHRHRAHGAAQGRQRVSDRDHAEPAGKRRGHPGDGGDPRHQRAQGRGKASGADGGPLPRAAGGRARRDGGGEPGRRDRPAERAGREAVRLPPRRTARPEGHEHHSGGLRRAADRRRSALRGGRAGAADRHRDRADRRGARTAASFRSRSC